MVVLDLGHDELENRSIGYRFIGCWPRAGFECRGRG